MGDALGGGEVVLGNLLVLEGIQQVLSTVLLVAVLHDGPQRLRPRHLGRGGSGGQLETIYHSCSTVLEIPVVP